MTIYYFEKGEPRLVVDVYLPLENWTGQGQSRAGFSSQIFEVNNYYAMSFFRDHNFVAGFSKEGILWLQNLMHLHY